MFTDYLRSGKKAFLNLFPPPAFLVMPAIGINISDHSVKIIELSHAGGEKIRLGQFGDEPIPDGVIKSGSINDREALRKILKEIKSKYQPEFVRVSLPEEKAYVFKIKIPETRSDKQIRTNIEFKLEENVPISVAEALFDYNIIPGSSNGGQMEVGVSVLPVKFIASYTSLFEEAGLKTLSFEIEAESIARAVIKGGDLDTYMIVDYGRTRTGFSVISRGVVRYTSTAEIGGESLTEIIKKETGKSEEEVKDIKNNKGLVKDPGNPELYMSLANIVSVLRDEINKRYIFWHTHKDKEGHTHDKIKKIILVGGNANLSGLEDYLSGGLKVKVEKADVWSNTPFPSDFVPGIGFKDSLSYASAIGLALRDFRLK